MSMIRVSAVATLEMIQQARYLSEGTDNTEYVRGQAELIAQFVSLTETEDIDDAISTITDMIGK